MYGVLTLIQMGEVLKSILIGKKQLFLMIKKLSKFLQHHHALSHYTSYTMMMETIICKKKNWNTYILSRNFVQFDKIGLYLLQIHWVPFFTKNSMKFEFLRVTPVLIFNQWSGLKNLALKLNFKMDSETSIFLP